MLQHSTAPRCRKCSSALLQSFLRDFAGLTLNPAALARTRFVPRLTSNLHAYATAKRSFSSSTARTLRGTKRCRDIEALVAHDSNEGKEDAEQQEQRQATEQPSTISSDLSSQKSSSPTAKQQKRRLQRKKQKEQQNKVEYGTAAGTQSTTKELRRLERKLRRQEAGTFGVRRAANETKQVPDSEPAGSEEPTVMAIGDATEAALDGTKNVSEKSSLRQASTQKLQERIATLEQRKATEDALSKAKQDALATNHEEKEQKVLQREQDSGLAASEEESDLSALEIVEKLKETEFRAPRPAALLFGMESDKHLPKALRPKTASDAPPAIPPPAPKESWQIQKSALKAKLGEGGWAPRKRLSPDSLSGIRSLHASDPDLYTTEALAESFEVSPEAIRRILKSKWRPNEDEARDRLERWERRGVRKWEEMAAVGIRPPQRWRAMGIKKGGVVGASRSGNRAGGVRLAIPRTPATQQNRSWQDSYQDKLRQGFQRPTFSPLEARQGDSYATGRSRLGDPRSSSTNGYAARRHERTNTGRDEMRPIEGFATRIM